MSQATSPFASARGALLCGRYRPLYPLGHDAKGLVFAAVNEPANREVALKYIPRATPEIVERLKRDTRALRASKPQQIVEIFEVVEVDGGGVYLEMELLQGSTIAQKLTKEGRLNPSEVARLGRDAANALSTLHAAGVIHGKVNPSEIFLHNAPKEGTPILKIVGFGVNRAATQLDLQKPDGGGVDVRLYTSPEQFLSPTDVDHRADIWALGVTLFEMLTGMRPFNSDTGTGIRAQIQRGEPPRVDHYVPHIAARFVEIVARCMQPSPSGRFSSAGDLAVALDQLINEQLISHQLVSDPEAPDSDGKQGSRGNYPSAGVVVDNRYRLLHPLGEGGMGSVWAAEDVRLRRDVAIKLLNRSLAESAELRRRFEREAIAAARLSSPNIVTIHDYGFDEESRPYIVQDLVRGRDLRHVLENETRLSLRRVVALAIQACSALEAIHAQGLIHRDIKPGNFIVTKPSSGHEHLVLLDFGIAKPVDGKGGEAHTTAGLLLGTPHYMSPEQINRKQEVDQRTDIYSLGATLYELASGNKPFVGDVPVVLHNKLTKGAAPLTAQVSDISPALNAVIMQCLEIDRDKRFPTVASLREALYATPEAADVLRLEVDPPSSRGGADARPSQVMGPPDPPTHPTFGPRPPASSASSADKTMRLDVDTMFIPAIQVGDGEAKPPLPFVAPARGAEPESVRGVLGVSPPSANDASPPPSSEARGGLYADFVQYLELAGLQVLASEKGLLRLIRRPESRLPDVDLVGILLEDSSRGASLPVTMETVSFQQRGSPLYNLLGTLERPIYVLAVFRGHPGAGIYRQWYDLQQTRHVRVLRLGPHELRAQMERKSAERHLIGLLQRPASNPFQLDGPVEREVDFFGSMRLLGELVAKLAGRGQSLGISGLKKWGITSFLKRLRLELSDRITAWVDIAGLVAADSSDVLSALYDDLARELRSKAPGATITPLQASDRRESRAVAAALRSLVGVCYDTQLGGPPIFFLDGVDELTRSRRCTPEELQVLVRVFYGLMSSDPRAILVFAGTDDDLLSKQVLGSGEAAFENPLWTRVDRCRAPFFDEDEVSEFFRGLGALAGLQFKADALDECYRLTGGQKYLCRLLGSEVHRRHAGLDRRTVDREDIRECILPLLASCVDYFRRLLDDAPPGAAELLARLVDAPAWEPDLLGFGSGDRATHRLRAFQFSIVHGLVRREPKSPYRLTIGLLGEWLRWNRGLISEGPAAAPEPRADHAPFAARRDAPLRAMSTTLVMHAADVEPTIAIASPSNDEKIELRKLITEKFPPHELELLADDLGVELSRVASMEKPHEHQVMCLVRWACQQGLFEKLRQLVHQHRYIRLG